MISSFTAPGTEIVSVEDFTYDENQSFNMRRGEKFTLDRIEEVSAFFGIFRRFCVYVKERDHSPTVCSRCGETHERVPYDIMQFDYPVAAKKKQKDRKTKTIDA